MANYQYFEAEVNNRTIYIMASNSREADIILNNHICQHPEYDIEDECIPLYAISSETYHKAKNSNSGIICI